ncbi:endonuclease/exonuclease/phosphatase family protein [Clostridium sp. UBA1056]|uniref:endonuclease/exonuclease/phosphatase family protein n=1 Tax=unclassified Clostridium TaxID=2614128 RepID=UPI0032161ECD
MTYQYQISLFDKEYVKLKANEKKIKILFWNIQNPSYERAKKQLEWMYSLNVDVFILTEVKLSNGFYYIKTELEQLGYEIVFNRSEEYFTVIAIREIKFIQKEFSINVKSQRIAMIEMDTFVGKVTLIGAYIPANGFEFNKIKAKNEFQEKFLDNIVKLMKDNLNNSEFIIGGDLNILEPGHNPNYPEFIKWNYFYEGLTKLNLNDAFRVLNPLMSGYTWNQRNEPQRLDYIFITNKIITYVEECIYIDKPREEKLSDHSAQLLILSDKNKQ